MIHATRRSGSRRVLVLVATLLFVPSLASATDVPGMWNPGDKESPEPYGYDVYTAPELPLGYVDPADPPATLGIPPIPSERAVLDVVTELDRSAYSWFGAMTVTAEVRSEGSPVADCDSVVVVSAANPRVRARLRDDGITPDLVAADGVYSGVFDIGAGEGEARPTGTYTATATAHRGAEMGAGTSGSFSLYSVRRWTGITTTNLIDVSDAYTTFFVTPNGPGLGFRHTIVDLGLIRSTAVPDAQIRIPVFPAANAITGLTVTGNGVSNVTLDGNVIAFDCDLTSGSVTRVSIEFDAPSDLAATRIDRYQTGDIGLRNFRNGYLIWNRYIHTAILGSSFTFPHGPGCIVDLHVVDLDEGDPHTIDCMERVAVHLDDSAVNDGTGTYPSNIKWDDDSLSWLQSADLESFVFRFESGGNYGVRDEVFVERHVEFYAQSRYFRHNYRIENIDTSSHDFDFVWGREQWLYGSSGGSNRQTGDRGLLPNDPSNYGGEHRLAPSSIGGNWFAAFDISSFYSIGVIVPGDSEEVFPTFVHFLCNPAIGNSTGEYPIVPSGSCSNMENIFFEKQLGVLEPGESVTYEFYQWGGYGEDRDALTALLWDDADALAPDPASVDHLPGGNEGIDTGGEATDGGSPGVPGTGAFGAGNIALGSALPNPFSRRTDIAFELPVRLDVSLDVYDVRGRIVNSLVGRTLPEGWHRVSWEGDDEDGRAVPNGVYFVRLAAAGQSRMQKITLGR